jgi:hypothetical protein
MKLSRDFVLKLKIDNGDDGKPSDEMMCTSSYLEMMLNKRTF